MEQRRSRQTSLVWDCHLKSHNHGSATKLAFLTAKPIFQFRGWGQEVKPDVLGRGSSDEEGENEELHGEAEVDTGLISTPLLPFIPRDKTCVFSLIQPGGRVVHPFPSIFMESTFAPFLFCFKGQ